jgi:RNA polymerase sigma-70 factor (ECF subfamily)
MQDFERIYRQHAAAVLRFARRCVGRKDIAEEIVSEAFLQLYRNFDRIDKNELPAWLFTVVRNRAIDYWRRNKLESQYIHDNPGKDRHDTMPFDGDLLDCRELRPVHRTCLILHYVHGMTRTEIAELIGMRETQIKGYLRSGLSTLRVALSDRTG